MYYWCSRSCWILNQVCRKSWDTHLFQLDVSSIGPETPTSSNWCLKHTSPTEPAGTNDSRESSNSLYVFLQQHPKAESSNSLYVFLQQHPKADRLLKRLVLYVHSTGSTMTGPIQVTENQQTSKQANKQKTIPSRVSLRESKADGWSFSTVHTVMLMHTSSGQDCGSWVVQALFSYNWWCMCVIH